MPRKKKRREPEYTLNLFYDLGEQTKQRVVVAFVQTTQMFVNFNYQILLHSEIEGTRITINIRGLHAPSLVLPAMGPARGKIELPPVRGRYALVIRKLQREINEFQVEFLPEEIRVLETPKNPFVTITTTST